MKLRNYVAIASLTLLGACAANTPASAPAPAPQAIASATTPAGGTTEAQQQFIKAAAHLGYKVETVKSERRYCRSTAVVESHLAKRECLNETQMAAKIQSAQDANADSLNGTGTTGVIVHPMIVGGHN
jgi:hypothetical protein